MSLPTVTDEEIKQIIDYLRSKGRNDLANKVEGMQVIKHVGSLQYRKGLEAIQAVEKTLTQRVPRDLILGQIQNILKEMEKYL
jgi:hypothetical protein